MTLRAVGYGAGTYDLPGQANIMRIAVGETDSIAPASGAVPLEHDCVVVLETNIDDSTAEDMADCASRLFDSGAIDVYQTPCLMKKGRSGIQLTVICSPSRVSSVEHVLFHHTSTIGVRRYRADRDKLIREQVTIQTPYGPVAAKVVTLSGGQKRMTVEFEDARSLATTAKVTLGEIRLAAEKTWGG